MQTNEIFERLTARFGEEALIVKLEEKPEPWVEVNPEVLLELARFLRDEQGLRFDLLMCLSGVHYEKEQQLGVTYHLNSTGEKHKLTLKVMLPADDAVLPSVESVWKTANWHEREAFDMYGIRFEGHPDLRRILCPDDWQGYPLRKDYKVQEFYRGMKVEY